jgi:hypothetical protein
MSAPRRKKSPGFSWDQIARCKAHVPRNVVHHQFAMETVLLNVETAYYYGMDAIGARFFSVLRQSATVEAAVQTLSTEFDSPQEQIREDTVRFCEELVSKGLLELSTG